MSMESHVEDLLFFSLTTHINATWLPEVVLFLVYASCAASPVPLSLILYLQLKVTTLNHAQHRSINLMFLSSLLSLTPRQSLFLIRKVNR